MHHTQTQGENQTQSERVHNHAHANRRSYSARPISIRLPLTFILLAILAPHIAQAKRTINIEFKNLYPTGETNAVTAPILQSFPLRVVNTSSPIGSDVEVNLRYVHTLKGLDATSNAKYGVFCDVIPPVCVGVVSGSNLPPFKAELAVFTSPFGTLQGACRTNYAYSGTQQLQCAKPGGLIEVRYVLKNIGALAWGMNDIRMISVGPLPTGWPESKLILEANVQPGSTGVFTGLVRAPVATGVWNLTWAVTSGCIGNFGSYTAPIELTCSNGVFCDGVERLVAGQCVNAVRPSCDDGQKCTIDICDEAKALCKWTMNLQDSSCAFASTCYTVVPNESCKSQCGVNGRLCGDDGCGGTCGTCPLNFGCSQTGQCVFLAGFCSQNTVPLLLPAANSSLAGKTYTKVVDLSKGYQQGRFSCSPDTTGPQVIYQFTVPNDGVNYGMDVRFSNGIGTASTLDVLLELRKGYCADPVNPASLILTGPQQNTWCNDDATPPGRVGAGLQMALSPGLYYLYAGGFNTQASGVGTITARFTAGYTPYCQARFCGPDGGGGDCGPCPEGLICDSLLRCSPPQTSVQCTTQRCANNTAVCGSDGCGGQCGPLNGACPTGLLCVVATGQCDSFPQCDHWAPTCVNPCNSTEFCATDCTCRPLAAPLPDLFLYSDRLRTSLVIDQRRFDNYSCAIMEGCIDGLGVRTLLKFDTSTVNQGRVKLTLPDPRTRPDEFVYGICHNHYHYQGFAEYQLLSGDGTGQNQIVKRGHKQGYCMLAENRFPTVIGPDVPCRGTTSCNNPGLDRGWMDTYGASLDCQWIDITGLPTGNYTLRVEVNAQRRILEETYDNNVELLPVWIP